MKKILQKRNKIIMMFSILLGILLVSTTNVYSKNGPCSNKNYYGGVFCDAVHQASGNTIYANNKQIPTQTMKGVTYNKSTNTLTLKNVKWIAGSSAARLTIQNMGDDFKLKLIGKNYITSLELYGYKYNNKIKILGNGTLYVNSKKMSYPAILISGNSFVKIENTCNVYLYKAKKQAIIRSIYTSKKDKNKWIVSSGKINKKISYKFKKKEKTKWGQTIKNVYYGTNGKNVYSSLKKSATSVKSNAISVSKSTVQKKEKITYKITFNPNGGKCSEKSRKKEKNKKIGKLPKAKRTGYIFKGWYTKKKKGSKVSEKTKVKGNMSVYAHWKAKKYRVTLYDNGRVKNIYYKITEKITLPEWKKDGYIFLGWYTKETGGKKVSTIKKGTTGNKNYYAHWEKAKVLLGQTITASDVIITLNTYNKNIGAKTNGNGVLSYKSSDNSIVSVDTTGNLYPHRIGSCEITISASQTSDHKAGGQKKIMVTVNSTDDYLKYEIANKLPYLLSENKYTSICPQGMCIAGDYILISGCNNHEKNEQNIKDSVIYVLDKQGIYKGIINLVDNKEHLGGIAYDDKNIFFASGKKIQYFSKNILDVFSQTETKELFLRDYKTLYTSGFVSDDIQISTLTYHKNALWIATNTDTNTFEIRAISFRYSGDYPMATKLVKNEHAFGKDKIGVNGITFESTESDRMFITGSVDRKSFSKLYSLTITQEILEDLCPVPQLLYDIPPMAEGMAIMDGKLLIVYESSSNYYKLPLKGNLPVIYPMDYLTVFRLSDF